MEGIWNEIKYNLNNNYEQYKLVELHMPREEEEMKVKKLNMILIWVTFLAILFTFGQTMDLLININNIPWYFILTDWVFLLVIYMLIIIAKCKNIKFTYWALLFSILRIQ